MTDEELLAQVRLLRDRGSSPKQIAKALGLCPVVVAPLVRQIAELRQSHDDTGRPGVARLLDQSEVERRRSAVPLVKNGGPGDQERSGTVPSSHANGFGSPLAAGSYSPVCATSSNRRTVRRLRSSRPLRTG